MVDKVTKLKKLIMKKLKETNVATIILKSGKEYKISNKAMAFKLIELYSEDIASIE